MEKRVDRSWLEGKLRDYDQTIEKMESDGNNYPARYRKIEKLSKMDRQKTKLMTEIITVNTR